MENKINWENTNEIKSENIIRLMDSAIKEFYATFQLETGRLSAKQKALTDRHEKEKSDFSTSTTRDIDSLRMAKSNSEAELLSKKQKAMAEANSDKAKSKSQHDAEYKRIEAAKSKIRAQMELDIDGIEQIKKRVDEVKHTLEFGFNARIFYKLWNTNTSSTFTFMQKTSAINISFSTVDSTVGMFNTMTGFFQKKRAKELARELCGFLTWAYKQIEDDKELLRIACEKECNELEESKKEYDEAFRSSINNAELYIREIEAEYRESIEKSSNEYQRKNQELTNRISNEETILNQRIEDEKEQFNLEASQEIDALYKKFFTEFTDSFPSDKISEYLEYHETILKPNYEQYSCRKLIPQQIEIGDLSVDATAYLENDSIREFLMTNYKDLFVDGCLVMPYAINLAEHSNMGFEYRANEDSLVIRHIQSLVNSILLGSPAMKVNFALIDPLKSTNTFAPFNKFIEVNKPSAKLLTGGIATSGEAITEKLKVVNDHMENIISTCLKSNEMSIQEYNELAGPNAEPYQIIAIMDFPANFTLEAAKYLEKIVETGPRCGVYTIVMTSKEQLDAADSKVQAVYGNIKNRLCQYILEGNKYNAVSVNTNGLKFSVELLGMLTDKQIDEIVPTYKAGIVDAGRIIVDYDYVQIPQAEWFKASTADSISIPIGLVGVNNVQNIELGADGVSHHALIAGQSGSGKTSLLHGMIMNALMKYSPEELEIYLIDFKRGVEFKVYANYNLPNFKVIAVESEREFGHSVLEHLDKEQKRRSDLFKKYAGCKNVAQYRELSGNKLPRILLIIDEYHELFNVNNSDHITAESAELLQRLLSQGRAFGIHVVLATQSIANVGGLSASIYELIAVRIALKCPESEGKLILGDSADAVNMIDASDSGKAIYNPNCGDRSVNSIFRVAYMDSERQVKLLNEISSVYEKTDTEFRTRVMLSNVEDDLNNRYMKYASGHNVGSQEARLYLGESLKVSERFSVHLDTGRGSNLLMIGKNKKQAREASFYSLLSLLMYQEVNKEKKIKIYVYDYARPEEVEKDFFVNISRQISSSDYVYVEPRNALMVFEQMYEEVITQQNEETYFIFMGLKLARDFRNDSIYSSDYYNMLVELIQKNSQLGCHAIIWDDSIKIFNNNYQGLLSYFDMRIAFNMSDEDGELFIDETNCNQLSAANAIFFSAGNDNKKFRTYILPSEESEYEESWVYRFAEKYVEKM